MAGLRGTHKVSASRYVRPRYSQFIRKSNFQLSSRKSAMIELLELPRGFSEILLSFVCFRVVHFLRVILDRFLPPSLRQLHGKYGSTGISVFPLFTRALRWSCQLTGRSLLLRVRVRQVGWHGRTSWRTYYSGTGHAI